VSEIIQIAEDSPTIVQVFSELTISGETFPTGGAVGQAVVVTQETPRILGWGDAAAGGGSGGLPSGGAIGEVLSITQATPSVAAWVNQIDGGTFN
jgi:hypothetical protein